MRIGLHCAACHLRTIVNLNKGTNSIADYVLTMAWLPRRIDTRNMNQDVKHEPRPPACGMFLGSLTVHEASLSFEAWQ